MLTRKDFVKLARQISAAPLPDDARRTFAETVAAHCAASNPRFDRVRFMDACGVRYQAAAERQTVQS